jgi:EAL domain-containing protein (putative c-di-GMP-specific phosphodiesterase class I)
MSYATTSVTDLSTALIAQQRLNRDRLIARENAADRIDSARASVVSTLQRVLGAQTQSSYFVKVIGEGLFDKWVVDVLKGATTHDVEERINLLTRFMGNESAEPDLSLDLSDLVDLFGDAMSQRPSVQMTLEECARDRNEVVMESLTTESLIATSLDLTPQEVELSVANRPRLARAVRAVRKLPLDTWFLHRSRGEHRYLQVVWVNRHNTRFVLSDERGVKQRDLSIIQLAFELGRSLKTLTTLEQLSLVEQTLFSKLSETKDDLSQAFVDESEDSSNRLLHAIERALRRARRVGITESTVSFFSAAEVSKESLEDLLAKHDLGCRCIEKPMTSQVCAIVSSTETSLITEIISDLVAQDGAADLLVEPIDPQLISDPRILLDRLLNKSAQPKKESASESEQALITPKSLDDAIQEAFVRLEPASHEIRLQPIIRVSTAASASPESAYLVSGQEDRENGASTENPFRHRDIRIATNFIELKEACRLLQTAESTGGSPTHLIVRLCPETCLHPTALDRILTLISEHTVGTSQLSFLIPDSMQIRESIICHRLTNALRSIGCHIVLENYNPARSSSEAIHELHASDIVLESDFWERAAQTEPWATVLPQIIADVHHILGRTVTVRNPLVTDNIEASGVDYIERHSAVALSPSEFLTYFGEPSHINT